MKSLFARKAARGHWPHEVQRRTMGGVHLRTNPSSKSVLSVCIAALGIVLVVSAQLAGATGTQDQSQEAQTDLNGVAAIGSQIAAQTFTAGLEGSPDQVDLLLTRYGSPGSLFVEIHTADAGVPTSQVIASGVVVDTNLDTDPYTFEWVSVVLSPIDFVSIGTLYAIVVRDAGGAIFPTDYFVWAEAEFDPYANGMTLTSVDGGTSWFPATSADFAFRTYVGPSTIEVSIDIKPGSATNPINLSSTGSIPVTILSTSTFDATAVDPASVCFGDAESPAERDCIALDGGIEDINGDGQPDLLLRFKTRETGIDPGDTQACLTGTTFSDASLEGCDSIKTF